MEIELCLSDGSSNHLPSGSLLFPLRLRHESPTLFQIHARHVAIPFSHFTLNFYMKSDRYVLNYVGFQQVHRATK